MTIEPVNAKCSIERDDVSHCWTIHVNGFRDQGTKIFLDPQVKGELLAYGIHMSKKDGTPIRVWREDEDSIYFAFGEQTRIYETLRFYDYNVTRFPIAHLPSIISDLKDIQEFCHDTWGCVFAE